MRICLVYDCLYPHTVGGAERWYRNLGERLAADGHEVSYLTLRQWDRGSDPGVPGVRVVVAGPRMSLYAGPGRRRILPPLVFGCGVLWHLLRHGRRYDVVHTASFPYFSLLAAALVRPLHGYRLIVDWFEVWTREYWNDYLGPAAGTVGWLVQRLCARIPHRAFCLSRLHAGRLTSEGHRGKVEVLPGAYAGTLERRPPGVAESVIVFAGRHIPEKQVLTIPPAIAMLRERAPELKAVILGDGPDRPELLRLVAELGLQDEIEVPGFVSPERVEAEIARATCLLLPSRREGYGMVVIEAAALGTPSIVVAGPDNAAVELIDAGVNGYVAASVDPGDLAGAVMSVLDAGASLRDSTSEWFARNAAGHSLGASMQQVGQAYEAAARR